MSLADTMDVAPAATDTRPPHPYLAGIHAPMKEELTLTELAVTGALPRELDGRYLRIGPNPVAADPDRYHWFSGDGMVHGVRIEGGRALWYRNRFIRSTSAAKSLGKEPAPGPRRGRSDIVNTNITRIGGDTYALVEAGSFPVRLSDELEDQVFTAFDDTLQGSFTAHPHLDPLTGEQHSICYDAMTPGVIRHVVNDATGRVVREQPISVQDAPSIHDCALTARYVVILDLPVTFSMEAAMQGFGMPFRWNPQHRPRVGLLPRDGGDADVIWCEVDPAYAFHTANAYDLPDGRVVVDLCAYATMFRDSSQGPDARSRGLERWTVDPQTRTVTTATLDDGPQDFPRIDERFTGREHHYAFTVATVPAGGVQSSGAIGLYRHDLSTGERQFADFGPGRHPGEFVFVPRAADAPEGDGWLIGYVVDAAAKTTEFVVLDAVDIAATPVARVHLPHLVPQGFHGNWIATAQPAAA